MVGSDQCMAVFGKMHMSDVNPPVKKNVVQMEEGKDTGVGSPSFQEWSKIETAESWCQDIRRHSLPPFVKIPENDRRTRPLVPVKNMTQQFRLVLPFP